MAACGRAGRWTRALDAVREREPEPAQGPQQDDRLHGYEAILDFLDTHLKERADSTPV